MAIAISDYNKIVGADERIRVATARNILTYTTVETVAKGINFNQMFHGVSDQLDQATHIAVTPVPMTSHIKTISISYASNVGAYTPGGKSANTGQAQNNRVYTVSAYVLPGVECIRDNDHFAQLRAKYATPNTANGVMNTFGIVVAGNEPITIFAREPILTLENQQRAIGSPIKICPMEYGLPMANYTLREHVLRLYKAANGQYSNVPTFANPHNVPIANEFLSNGVKEEVEKADIGMLCLQITSNNAAEVIFAEVANNAICPIITVEYIKGTLQSGTPSYPGFRSVSTY